MPGGTGARRVVIDGSVRLRVELRNTPYQDAQGAHNGVLERSARLNGTWYEFLVNVCGLPLEANSPFFVCSKTYVINPRISTVKSNYDMGWRAGLEEKVGDFISKYKRNRSLYTVRLTHGLGVRRGHWRMPGPGPDAAVRVAGGGGGGNRDTQVPLASPAPVPIPIPIYRSSTHADQRNVKVEDRRMPSLSVYSGHGGGPEQGGASSSKSSSAREDLLNNFLNDVVSEQRRPTDQNSDGASSSDVNMDDDAVSDGTAANDERAELNADGIEVENLTPTVMTNVLRLDNTLFLRARKEIKRLRANGLWSKHQKRAPFVSIVIEELLRASKGD